MAAYSQDIEKRGVSCENGYQLEAWREILLIPNDDWTVFTCTAFDLAQPSNADYGFRYTKVVKTDLSQSWIVSHKDLVWSKMHNGYLSTYRWSQDKRYLYLVPHISGIDGFPISAYFWDASNLYRLHLESGNFETILNDVRSFSLSPNDQLVISTESDKPSIIHLTNLSDAKSQQTRLGDEVAITGIFVWNFDSTRVVFASGYENDTGAAFDDLSATSIFLLTIKNLHLQTLLQKDSRLLVPSLEFPRVGYWIDANTISLTSLKHDDEFSNDISLNIQTGEIRNLVIPTVELEMIATP